MKSSFYTYYYQQEGKYYIYHQISSALLEVEEDLFRALHENQVTHIPQDIQKTLTAKGFLVGDDVREVDAINEANRMKRYENKVMRLTLMPTMACNFSCWYCYENHHASRMTQQARNNNQTYQLLTTMQEIKLQGCERRRRKEWEDVQRDLFSVQSRSLSLQQKEEVGALFINESKNIVITAMSAAAVISGDLTLGMMLAVQYIIGQLNVPVLQLLGLFYTWQDVNISMDRIGEIQETAEEDAERHQRKLDGTHDIVLEHVSFRYDPFSATPTLSDLSLTVPEGCVTAIVGASGSGKTTLVKMLLGFYPVETGKILVGGCDLADINLQWWRSQCGVVMQDGVLFSESIVRNIAVSDEEVDMQRVDESARIACIRDHVLSLPLKYETKIGRDGMGLSQGQKQRILIARAIYRNPSFVFLDEATNSLDATNEQQIVNNLRDYYAGRTVVIIAHRLSTVKTADQIVVMNSGRVVEQGNHATLLKYHGVYWQLVKNQM